MNNDTKPAVTAPDVKLLMVRNIAQPITMDCLGISFGLRIERDVIDDRAGRIFLQVIYHAPCTKTGIVQEWRGRKWYLSGYMTADEIVKTAYAAFEATVKHEIMEGFKFDGQILFNPHVSFRALLSVSDMEVSRPIQQPNA